MLWTVVATALACADPAGVASIEAGPSTRVGDLPVTLTIVAKGPDGEVAAGFCGTAELSGVRTEGGPPITTTGSFRAGTLTIEDAVIDPTSGAEIRIGKTRTAYQPRHIPGWASLLPPLLAIALAVLTRQALLALFGGVWVGALFLHGYNPLSALLASFDEFLVTAVADRDHAAILLFTLALGGIVGILARSGATRALVDVIASRARTRRSGLLTAWASGLVVFFDDYANCLLVGNTVRPFTDRMRVSREKLAFIVDSTAAPIATVAIISTWVGFQIGLFDDVFEDGSGYSLFLSILPYSYYSFLTIAFVFLIAYLGRDFGPMLRAERRAIETGALYRPGSKPLMDAELTDDVREAGSAPWWMAAVSVGSIVVIVMLGLYVTGAQAAGAGAPLRKIVSSSDPYAVLLWASFGGSLLALVLTVGGRHLGLDSATEAWIGGVKSMVMAVLVLVLAWAIGDVCKNHLLTGKWLLSNLSPSPALLPTLTFVGAAVIALSTGSSFSTMAIMIPIAAPMAWTLTEDPALSAAAVETIRYSTLAAILSGAVFGDHCSPISDTTIMSSMSSASDHVDHVRTQMPYAVVVGSISIAVGFLPAGFGVSPLVGLPVGLVLVFCAVRFLGKPVVTDGDTG